MSPEIGPCQADSHRKQAQKRVDLTQFWKGRADEEGWGEERGFGTGLETISEQFLYGFSGCLGYCLGYGLEHCPGAFWCPHWGDLGG